MCRRIEYLYRVRVIEANKTSTLFIENDLASIYT